MEYVILGVASLLVSIGSAIAGGGGGLVMTPLALLLGIPPQTALATSKASGVAINLGALAKFSQHKDTIVWRWAVPLSVLAIIASVIGTRIVFVLEPEVLENLIGIITVGLVPIVIYGNRIGLAKSVAPKWKQALGIIFFFIIMIMQAGLGSGIGMLLMFVFMSMLGFDAISANATKRVSGLVLAVVSFIIFAFSGYVDWLLAACLGAGMLCGGYIGAHLAVKHGNLLVRKALLAVSLITGAAVLLT